MPKDHEKAKATTRVVHKTHPGEITFHSCETNMQIHHIKTSCYAMGGDARGLTLRAQHQVEANKLETWALSICFDHSMVTEAALYRK
jgi:hypothetical protein